MLTHVEIENFRGFSKLALDLRPISVLVGPNSSGKTSVLHAVSLALRAYGLALDDRDAHPALLGGKRIQVCKQLIVRDHTRLLPIAERNELFRDGTVAEGTTCAVVLVFDETSALERLEVSLSYMRNAVSKLSVIVESTRAASAVAALPKKSKYLAPKLVETLHEKRPTAILVPAFYGVTLEEEYRSAPVIDELLQSGQQSRIVRNLVARLDGAGREELNAFLLRTVGARVTSATTSGDTDRVNPLSVRFADTNGNLDLSAAGAGLVNLVALFAALKFGQARGAGETIYLFDEPEAHLHPRLQGALGDELAATVRQFAGAQMVAATHSVEMINRLGRRDDVVLYAVDRSSSVATALPGESEIVDALESWADLSPFASLSFLASRRLLFHEGPTDRRILTRCAELLFRNDGPKLSRFRSWTLVPLDGTGNIPSVAALQRVINQRVFPSLSKKQRVRVVLVLDRDHVRSPGVSTKTDGNVEIGQVVWGRHSIESLFIDADVLSAWLSPTLPSVPVSQLKVAAASGIAEADTSNELSNAAAAQALPALMNQGHKPQEAMKMALARVQGDPATFQRGKDRAGVVLKHIRAQLPRGQQNHVRSTIADVVEAASIASLSLDAVPKEIAALLARMVAE